VGPRAGLDLNVEERNLLPLPGIQALPTALQVGLIVCSREIDFESPDRISLALVEQIYKPVPYISIYTCMYLMNSLNFSNIIIFINKGLNKTRNFVICVYHLICLGVSNQGGGVGGGGGGKGVYFVWEGREKHTGCWWKNLKEAYNLKALGLGWKIIVKCTLKK
jgi:hypothetical protein